VPLPGRRFGLRLTTARRDWLFTGQPRRSRVRRSENDISCKSREAVAIRALVRVLALHECHIAPDEDDEANVPH